MKLIKIGLDIIENKIPCSKEFMKNFFFFFKEKWLI